MTATLPTFFTLRCLPSEEGAASACLETAVVDRNLCWNGAAKSMRENILLDKFDEEEGYKIYKTLMVGEMKKYP